MDAAPPSDSSSASMGPSFAERLQATIKSRFQQFLDASNPHVAARWVFLMCFLALYTYRTVSVVRGFYIVSYGLGIFLLNLFIGFLTPLDLEEDHDGPMLPLDHRDEFKPFIRRLPEFKPFIR